MKEFDFIGATDSACPCAIMMDIAQKLTPHISVSHISLQFIFFDGKKRNDAL